MNSSGHLQMTSENPIVDSLKDAKTTIADPNAGPPAHNPNDLNKENTEPGKGEPAEKDEAEKSPVDDEPVLMIDESGIVDPSMKLMEIEITTSNLEPLQDRSVPIRENRRSQGATIDDPNDAIANTIWNGFTEQKCLFRDFIKKQNEETKKMFQELEGKLTSTSKEALDPIKGFCEYIAKEAFEKIRELSGFVSQINSTTNHMVKEVKRLEAKNDSLNNTIQQVIGSQKAKEKKRAPEPVPIEKKKEPISHDQPPAKKSRRHDPNRSKRRCIFCGRPHHPAECNEDMGIKERIKIVNEGRWCHLCLIHKRDKPCTNTANHCSRCFGPHTQIICEMPR